MRLLTFFLLSITIISCNTKNDCCSPGNETYFDISITNSNNEDLLNSKTPNFIDASKIRIYNLINGDTILFYDNMLDAEYGYLFHANDTLSTLRFFLPEFEFPESHIIIQWPDSTEDLIKCELNKSNSVTYISIIYFNNKLAWRRKTNDSDYCYFNIIK